MFLMTNGRYCISIHSSPVIFLTMHLWKLCRKPEDSQDGAPTIYGRDCWVCRGLTDVLLLLIAYFVFWQCSQSCVAESRELEGNDVGRASLHTVHSVTVEDIAVWYRWMEKVFCLSNFRLWWSGTVVPNSAAFVYRRRRKCLMVHLSNICILIGKSRHQYMQTVCTVNKCMLVCSLCQPYSAKREQLLDLQSPFIP